MLKKGPVNIFNDCELKSNLYVRPENIFPNFWHCHMFNVGEHRPTSP